MSKNNKYIWDDIEEVKAPPVKKSKRLIDEFEKGYSTQKPPKSKVKKVHVEKKVKKNRFKARLVKLLTTIVVLLLLFAPLFTIETINITETNFTSEEEFIQTSQLAEGDVVSIYDIVRIDYFYKTETISGVEIEYDFKTKALNVQLEEITPIAINSNNELYYVYDDKVKKSSSLDFPAPKLQGFDTEKEEALVNSMKELEYDVIKEIATIQLVPNEISDELVLMQMKDGNYVQIMISQIPFKMPYYNQISQTIDAVKGGQDGIIHLDRGDYYEPI